MNEDNRTTQYEVIVKNVTPNPQKSIIAVTKHVNKMTITSTFRYRFQHIIRQIVCPFISSLSMYNIIMFEPQ